MRDTPGETPRPERPPLSGVVEALRVRRNATVGLAAGLAVALLAYLFRVLELVGPVAGTREFPVLGPEGWYLILAFTLAAATSLLVATALTVGRVARLAREEL